MERIVQVPVEVIKEVIVERPVVVEKLVEVIKIIEKPVEKVVLQ